MSKKKGLVGQAQFLKGLTMHTYYMIVVGTWKYKDLEYAVSWCPEKFKSIKEAKKYWIENYKNRKQKDGWDQYYNNLPFIVEKITQTREIIKDEHISTPTH